jgi:hypothetical protein
MIMLTTDNPYVIPLRVLYRGVWVQLLSNGNAGDVASYFEGMPYKA